MRRNRLRRSTTTPDSLESDLPVAGSIGSRRPAARVVRIIARLNVGGPAIHVTNLSVGLDDSYPTILVAGVTDSSEADMTPQALARGVHLVSVPELGRRINLWQDLVAFAKLYGLLRKVSPAIVHTHTAKAGTLGRLAAVAAGVPIRVHTYHGHVMRGYFSPLVTRLVIAVERVLARVTTCCLTVSDLQAAELVDDLRICGPAKMRVVPLGFDLDRFDSERLDLLRGELRVEIGAGEEPIVTAVGRLVPIKNHALLLRAASQLRANGRSFHLVIVGGGPEESALRASAAALGLSDRVHFLGWRQDLDRIYADSTVVALSSINEGTPVCLIEALAAGCAIAATDVGGVSDVLDGGRLGELVPADDPSALAAAIDRLLGSEGTRNRLAREGRLSARERFGIERLLGDMSALYDELSSQRLVRG